MRNLTLNVALVIGALSSLYFGIFDLFERRPLNALVSFLTICLFVLIMLLHIRVPRFNPILYIGFTVFVGIIFLVLLATQFPDPTIALWCFPFPLVALFLLGHKQGLVAVVIFNLAVMGVFFISIQFHGLNYGHEYSIRYCAVMFVISVISYYYEVSRARSQAHIQAVNQSLEQRVEQRTKSLAESQERLHQAEKLEAIGLLAGGVAHDFNNQLTGIMAFADLIRVNSDDKREIQEYSENILAGARRSADLTSQLLAFARKGNILNVPVDMHHIVTDVISLLTHTIDKRITLRQQLGADPPTIFGDPTQLQNALLNIALNARDAMPAGGVMTFTTDIVDLQEEYCKTLPFDINPGSYLRLCIADTGSGMDKQMAKRIFEPFFTTKELGKGTGMGLSAVYGIVRSHSGAITVASEPEHGSTFCLYFPSQNAVVQIPDSSAESAFAEKDHGHILLVDDDDAVSAGSSKILQMAGYTVTVFKNGKDALDYFKDNWKSVDLVILDMIMPVMNGKDTYIAMKSINPDIVALLSSGYCLSGEAQNILDMGVKDFIQKPFDIAELRLKIFTLLRQSA
jgi:signal transduction histidine kinase/ActR/RegA family two-component response regulator